MLRFKFCEIAGFYVKDHITDDFLRLKRMMSWSNLKK